MTLSFLLDACNDTYFLQFSINVSIVVYDFLTPCYFILGLLGHTLSLLAYFRRAKSEKAYIFQILVTISNLLSVIFTSVYVATFVWWSGIFQPGPTWYTQCYGCMWFSAHMSMTLVNTMNYTTQLLSTFMAYDRLQSLRKQQNYKEPSKRQYTILATLSFAIGLSMGGFQLIIWNVVPDAVAGYIVDATAFFLSPASIGWVFIRNIILLLSLVALYFLNIGIPYLYYRNMNQVKNAMTTVLEVKRRTAARMLTILSVSECLLITLGNTVTIAFYICVAIGPPCLHQFLFASIMDGIMEITSIVNFYWMCAINKRYRKMIVNMLRSWCQRLRGGGPSTSSSVQPANEQQFDDTMRRVSRLSQVQTHGM